MKNKILLIILVSVLPQLYAQESSYAVQDRELSLIYARHAWSAFESSRWSDFQSLTEKGLEYDDRNPDLLGFKGVQAMNAARYADAFQWFTKAWYSGLEPEVLSHTDIMGWLFEVGFRLKKDDELESYYFSGSEMVRDDPEIVFYAARSLRRLGRDERALELAEEGLYRYQDQRFLLLLCGWTGEERYVGMLSEYIGRQGILYPDLFAWAVVQSRGSVSLASLYAEQINDLNSWFFKQSLPGFDEADFTGSCDGRRTWPLESFIAFRSAYPGSLPSRDGELNLDGDGDGIADIFLQRDDEGMRWSLDPGQDGDRDHVFTMGSAGKIVSVQEFDPQRNLSLHFYDYPYVDRVVLSGGGRSSREYLFLPGSMAFPLVPGSGDGIVYILSHSDAPMGEFLPESDLLKRCFSLIEQMDGRERKPFREYMVVDGMIRRFREDSNQDGRFDRIVLIEDWLPYEGYRDIDGSGSYELKEKYIDGRLAGFEYEGPDSRMEEYQDLWNRNRFQLWDFSRDNFFDAYLRRREDGSWEEYLLTGDE